jgi:peptidoglycan/LPS O-acetylase OafA/YrhL
MSSASTRTHYPALDGLRGIAIILVICCHNFNFIPRFEFGWIGVDLFFVLSGFLITDLLIQARGSRNFLQNFYLRRVLRIFPLYYAIVLLYFIFTPGLDGLQAQYTYYQAHPAMPWLHLQNWLYILHPKPNDNLLMGHFWSLSVEEQFYLIWPFVVLATKNLRWLGRISLGLFAVSIVARFGSWLYFGDGYTNFHLQYMTRIDGLCVGSLVAVWRKENMETARRKLLILATIILGAHGLLLVMTRTVIRGIPNFPFLGYASIAMLFGLAVYFAIEKRSRISKTLLENRFIRYTGRVSYGLYVFHWPILSLARLYLIPRFTVMGMTGDTAYMLASILALLMAIGCSIASYHFFEQRILALKDVITSEGYFARMWKRLSLLLRPASAR